MTVVFIILLIFFMRTLSLVLWDSSLILLWTWGIIVRLSVSLIIRFGIIMLIIFLEIISIFLESFIILILHLNKIRLNCLSRISTQTSLFSRLSTFLLVALIIRIKILFSILLSNFFLSLIIIVALTMSCTHVTRDMIILKLFMPISRNLRALLIGIILNWIVFLSEIVEERRILVLLKILELRKIFWGLLSLKIPFNALLDYSFRNNFTKVIKL